jgi:hypothetical protein
LTVCLSGIATGAEKVLLKDEWFAVYLTGKKAGHAHSTVAAIGGPAGETVYETTEHLELTISRGLVAMRIVEHSRVREDAAGRLIEFSYAMAQGPVRQSTRGKVEDGKLIMEHDAAGMRRQEKTAVPAALCPEAAQRLAEERGLDPGTEFTLTLFVPALPTVPVETSVRVGQLEAVDVYDVKKRLHRVDSTISIMPGMTITEWVDPDYETWLARLPLAAGMPLDIRRTTRDIAMMPDEPTELMLSLFVVPDRGIPNVDELAALRLLLTANEEGYVLPDLPEGPWQEVEETEKGTEVTVRSYVDAPDLNYQIPYAGEEHADYLRASKWLEADAPVLKRMAAQAIGDATDAATAARRIESYVGDTIANKSLGIGMATAAETALNREGDCSEHAVLVAGLCRSAGIPSRVVVGLVYVPDFPGYPRGIFGFHLWAEAWVGQWMPLDATLSAGWGARHIALVWSSLNGDAELVDVSAAVRPALGKLDIKVLDMIPVAQGRDRQ